LKPEELRVLKIMNEVTHRMDLNEFAQAAELEVSEALQCIQDLAKSGHLKRSGGGYGITEKGKAVLKVQSSVADGLEFRFYSELGQPTGVSARSVMEFYETIKMILIHWSFIFTGAISRIGWRLCLKTVFLRVSWKASVTAN
jgi:predicted transcriptional regulator